MSKSLIKTLSVFSVILLCSSHSFASDISKDGQAEASPVRASRYAGLQLSNLDSTLNGQFKFAGTVSWVDEGTHLEPRESEIYEDIQGNIRINNKTYLTDTSFMEIHYEAVGAGGDTRKRVNELQTESNAFSDSILFGADGTSDNTRLMDLTRQIDEDDSYSIYHRLDRMYVALQPEWGSISIGRQALTWGNGLLFNPMDLFNPFSPAEIVRDYKLGDDMAVAQISTDAIDDLQLAYTPRRNPDTERVEWESSSVGGKIHFSPADMEFDLMTAMHYQDVIIGIGSAGYLGDALWRSDAVWTFLHDHAFPEGFLLFVANIDYSWSWWGKNYYGFIELYYNGLGKDDYSTALSDSDLSRRIERGDMFSLGSTYLSGEIQMEIHALLNARLTAISNIIDPSEVLIPWVVWDFAESYQLTIGAQLYCGKENTEYGGFDIPLTNEVYEPSDAVFLWLTRYF